MNYRDAPYEVRIYQVDNGRHVGTINADTPYGVMWGIEGEREHPNNEYRWEAIRMSDGVILAQSRTDQPGDMSRWCAAQQEAKS